MGEKEIVADAEASEMLNHQKLGWKKGMWTYQNQELVKIRDQKEVERIEPILMIQ